MVSVLNKRWLSKGWHIMDLADSSTMALAFIEVLDKANVPYEHYDALYHRANALHVQRLNQGKDSDEFSANMMVSCWSTKGGLRDELRERDIRSGKYLPDAVAGECPHCFGSGWWNPDGRGLRAGCPHPSKVEVVE